MAVPEEISRNDKIDTKKILAKINMNCNNISCKGENSKEDLKVAGLLSTILIEKAQKFTSALLFLCILFFRLDCFELCVFLFF